MSLNVEDMLHELLRFDRRTNDKVKVEKMTKVVATMIQSEILQADQHARLWTYLEMAEDSEGGHA